MDIYTDRDACWLCSYLPWLNLKLPSALAWTGRKAAWITGLWRLCRTRMTRRSYTNADHANDRTSSGPITVVNNEITAIITCAMACQRIMYYYSPYLKTLWYPA